MAIFALAILQSSSSLIFMLPAFGSTSVLVFVEPDSPFSKPRNVIGGHVASSIAGLAAMTLFGHGAVALALGLAIAILAMLATRTLHPPAGSDPLAIILSSAPLSFLVEPILLGSVAIVLIAIAYHRSVTKRPYPSRIRDVIPCGQGAILPILCEEDVPLRTDGTVIPCACSQTALETTCHSGIRSTAAQKR
jgi:CBS-domain-containing membrane protein